MENLYTFDRIESQIEKTLESLELLYISLQNFYMNKDYLNLYINGIRLIISRIKNSNPKLIDIHNLIAIHNAISSILDEINHLLDIDEEVIENDYQVYHDEDFLQDNKHTMEEALELSTKLPYTIASFPQDFIDTFEVFLKNSKERINQTTELAGIKIATLEKQIEHQNITINNLQDRYEQDIKKISEENQTKSQLIIDELNKKLEEAKKILNLIGDTGIIGNYTKVANEHKKLADNFRYISLGIMLIMASILIYTLCILSPTEFNPYIIITRVIIASLLTYPAIYTARESSKHRTLETKNRSLELELASLSPFIELMDESDKLAIKKELIPKYFTGIQAETIDKEKDMETMVDNIQKLSKAIAPLIHKEK